MLAQGAAAGQARGDQGAALGGREGGVAVVSSPRPGVIGALVPSKQPLLEEAARPQKAERDHLVGAQVSGVADGPTLCGWTVGIAVPREGAMTIPGSMGVLGWEVRFRIIYLGNPGFAN